MLGAYVNFPENVHRTLRFASVVSSKRLQHGLIEAFHKLNNDSFNLENVAPPSVPQCKIVFEFGIAEGNDFNYIDEEEKDRLLKAIDKKPFQIMDFLCALRYYQIENEKQTPLKFDYYMIRFRFDRSSTEIRVFHERGPMHVSPKDLPDFLINNVNATFQKKVLKPS